MAVSAWYWTGSENADKKLKAMLHWDVNNGIARRSWARNKEAMYTAHRAMKKHDRLKITMPNVPDDSLLDGLFE